MPKDTVILFYPLVDPNIQIPNLPFPLLNLERMIRDLPIKIILIDERINPDYENILIENKDRLLLAGVSAMSGYQMISGRIFSEIVKKHCESNIIWGGWFVSVAPEIALKEEFVDFIITGQGEIPFKNFAEAIINKQSYEDISGLGYKQNGCIRINDRDLPVDENTYADLDFTAIDIEKIINVNGDVNTSERSINYISGSGCPYNCAFCCLPAIWKQKSFKKSIDKVIADLKYFNKELKIYKIGFNDDNFFNRRTFVIELCERIISEDINITWEANAHIDTFLNHYTDENIKLICQAGCKSVKFGVESGDQDVLDKINKQTTVQSCLDIAKRLTKYDLKCVFYIMVAFPWDPNKDLKLTLKFLGKAKLINKSLETAINFVVPLPATPLYEESIKYGFKPLESFAQFEQFVSEPFYAPWWKKDYRKEIHDYIWFYFKYADPKHYKSKSGKIKTLDYIINKICYPICFIRLKYNIRHCRIDAYIYFFLKRIFNRITKNKYAENSEIIGRCRSWNR